MCDIVTNHPYYIIFTIQNKHPILKAEEKEKTDNYFHL